ncbi:MAG: hypothetical protein ACI4JB_07800 [Porcipelethomonas sp.]
MKKFYEEAEMEIIKFQNEDIITTSGDVDDSGVIDPGLDSDIDVL